MSDCYRDQGVGVTVLCPGPVITNIMASMPPVFGPEVATRGPDDQFAPLQPGVVGEQVAEAILHHTFMVYTHDHVRESSSSALPTGMRLLPSRARR